MNLFPTNKRKQFKAKLKKKKNAFPLAHWTTNDTNTALDKCYSKIMLYYIFQ